MADAKTLAAIGTAYSTHQNGDLIGLERGGVAGRMTMAQFKADSFTWSGAHNFSGATVTWDAGPLDVLAGTSVTGVSGADLTLLTGTAGTNGQAAIWNADGDVVGRNFAQAAAGAGQWQVLNGSDGAALSLPAGGTWAFFVIRVTTATGATGTFDAGVAAGGSSIAGALAGTTVRGFCWRVA
jgi:hypothetical protein